MNSSYLFLVGPKSQTHELQPGSSSGAGKCSKGPSIPAIQASEYQIFDNDLKDRRFAGAKRKDLVDHLQPYDKQLGYPDSQLPVLMTLASEADTAVGRIFPIARSLQAVVNPRLFGRRYRTGLGHEPEVSIGTVSGCLICTLCFAVPTRVEFLQS